MDQSEENPNYMMGGMMPPPLSDNQRQLTSILKNVDKPGDAMRILGYFIRPEDVPLYKELQEAICNLIFNGITMMKLRRPEPRQIAAILSMVVTPDKMGAVVLDDSRSTRDILSQINHRIKEFVKNPPKVSIASIQEIHENYEKVMMTNGALNDLTFYVDAVLNTKDTNTEQVHLASLFLIIHIKETLDHHQVDIGYNNFDIDVDKFTGDTQEGNILRMYGPMLVQQYYIEACSNQQKNK